MVADSPALNEAWTGEGPKKIPQLDLPVSGHAFPWREEFVEDIAFRRSNKRQPLRLVCSSQWLCSVALIASRSEGIRQRGCT